MRLLGSIDISFVEVDDESRRAGTLPPDVPDNPLAQIRPAGMRTPERGLRDGLLVAVPDRDDPHLRYMARAALASLDLATVE